MGLHRGGEDEPEPVEAQAHEHRKHPPLLLLPEVQRPLTTPTLHGKGTLTPQGKEPRNYTLSAEMLATLAATGIAVQGRLQPRITITDRSENRSLALHRKKKLQQPATSERQL
ncbi:hypothetical protein YC2023_049889 [Brassica napus]